MSNLLNTRVWVKVIISPSLIFCMGIYLNSEISMPSSYMYLALGLLYALGAQMLEVRYLNKQRIWLVTGLDAVLAFGMIMILGIALGSRGVHVSLFGAFIYTVLQGGIEHILHLSALPRKKKWQKTPKRKR